MLNNQEVKDELAKLIPFHLASNVRRYQYAIIDSTPFPTSLGYKIDVQPFEGKIVEYTDTFMLVKIKPTAFRVVDLELVTDRPAIGTKVCITPYARRRFDGRRVDEPEIETSHESIPGGKVAVNRFKFGIDLPKLPINDVKCSELRDLINQIQQILAPDGFRTLAQVLVDANAKNFSVNDPKPKDIENSPPHIKLYVTTSKFSGYITLYYSRFFDSYGIFYQKDGELGHRVWPIVISSLAEKLVELIDDGSWRLIKVEPLKTSKRNKA